jgi:hypothetical protein
MNPVPPPDPEIMKHCRFNTGDVLYFVFDDEPTGQAPRPMSVEELKQFSLTTLEQFNYDALVRTFTEPVLRQLRPDLLPPEARNAPPAQP